jgi:hypothetical protein
MLGIALVAVLALCAVAASAASAAEFKSTTSPVTISGSQEGKHKFTVDGTSVECTNATFLSESTATPAKTVTVTPTYSECTAFGFAKAKVEMNGCKYEFLQPNASLEGNVAFRCGANKARVFVSSLGSECEVLIGESGNTNLSKVTYENIAGSPTKVKVLANVTGITAEKTKDTSLCPLKGTGTVTNASYTGNTLTEGNSGIGISVG